jgi:regulator of sigma E protease
MIITLGFFQTLGDILIFLIVLGTVICIHELGHFFFAKKAGILCHEFAFGMGPRIWSKKFGETVFSIRLIPFGGFVSMAGEEIEAEIIKVGSKIRVGFNNKNEIDRIILNPDNINYQDCLKIEVLDFDLSSEEGNRLYINEYTVKREAMYVHDKQQLQIAPKDRNFVYKSKTQRFLATFGGPLMNFILAFVVFLIISWSVGVPDMNSTKIGSVADDTPAYGIIQEGDVIISINGVDVSTWDGDSNSIRSELVLNTEGYEIVVLRGDTEVTLQVIKPQYVFYGLGFTSTVGEDNLIIGTPLYLNSEILSGDKIISIDGNLMNSWEDVINFALGYTNGSTEESPTEIVVERDGTELTFTYVAYGDDVLSAMGYDSFYSRIGIGGTNKFSFFGGFGSAWDSFVSASTSIYKTIALMFTSEQVGVDDLSGFVGIFTMTSQAASNGIISLLSWVGLLSVNLGIVNLLPIPALDGGRIVFIGYEAITRRKPNQKVENLLHTVMFFILMGLLVLITYNDILRLIGLK